MTSFQGTLFDGLQATRVPVSIEAAGGEITIIDATGASRRLRQDDIAPDSRIPDVPRRLRLSGGELIETDDDAAVEAVWPARDTIGRAAFMLESRGWAAWVGLGVTAVVIWIIVADLLPLAAGPASSLISPQVERVIGEHTLATLDRVGFKPSALSEPEQASLRTKFDAFVADEPDVRQYALRFRKIGVANALALPGGIIVVSDEMVHAVQTDDEFLAVVAHEIGHVRQRHAMRMVLQDSGLAVVMTVLAGDAVGTTILVAAIPSLLLRSRYSRQFESEADDYAFAMLKRHGRSPQAFADMLRRLQSQERVRQQPGALGPYLNSHPATEERIRRAEDQR
jgi:predicted Zn-dependent protease